MNVHSKHRSREGIPLLNLHIIVANPSTGNALKNGDGLSTSWVLEPKIGDIH